MTKKKDYTYKWAKKQLKPCPFCGFHIIDFLPQDINGRFMCDWIVKCGRCNGAVHVISKYQASAIASWNNRRGVPREAVPNYKAGSLWMKIVEAASGLGSAGPTDAEIDAIMADLVDEFASAVGWRPRITRNHRWILEKEKE